MKRGAGLISIKWACCLLAAALLSVSAAWARSTTPDQAKAVVRNWLALEAAPLKTPLGGQIKEIQTFNDDAGIPAYYVAYLNPGGLVFLPADDLVEPIIGFVSDATSYDPSPKNPLGALVNRDIPGRVFQARQIVEKNPDSSTATGAQELLTAAQQKWVRLSTSRGGESYAPSVSDVRVAALVQSTWDQGGADGSYPPNCNYPCYNYYTPPYSAGNSGNYLDGCGATAMAQLMRFWLYPTAGVGTQSFSIWVDGAKTIRALRGGDGSGGPYNWGANGSNMPLIPSASTTPTQRAAIGALCADAGVSVSMAYTQGDSSSYGEYAAWALVHTFQYSNAIAGSNNPDNINKSTLHTMLNPNLDAGFPALLAIYGSKAGGHIIVCDGYGYNSATLYHHLNLGWSGEDNAWYNLPTIDTNNAPFPNGNFDTVMAAIYNIYTSGSGEIISGRVTDGFTPLSGVTITATGSGGPYTTTTNANGIYALAKVPSNNSFSIRASKSGYYFTSKSATTGTSVSAVTAPPRRRRF